MARRRRSGGGSSTKVQAMGNVFIILGILSLLASLLFFGTGLLGVSQAAQSADTIIIDENGNIYSSQAVTTTAFGLFLLLFSVIVSSMYVIAGFCMRNGKAKVFCVIMSCVMALGVPVGTIIGILALVFILGDEGRFHFNQSSGRRGRGRDRSDAYDRDDSVSERRSSSRSSERRSSSRSGGRRKKTLIRFRLNDLH